MPIKSLVAYKLPVTRRPASSSRPPPSSAEAAVSVAVSEEAALASPLPAEVCAAARARRAEAFADAERAGLVSAPDDSVPAGWLPDERVRGGYSAGPQADGWAPALLADGSVPLAGRADLPEDDLAQAGCLVDLGGYSAPALLADGSVPLAGRADSAALPADDSALLEQRGGYSALALLADGSALLERRAVDSALADLADDSLVG